MSELEHEPGATLKLRSGELLIVQEDADEILYRLRAADPYVQLSRPGSPGRRIHVRPDAIEYIEQISRG